MSFDSGKILEETKKKKDYLDELNKALEKDKIDYNKAIKGINNKTNAVKEWNIWNKNKGNQPPSSAQGKKTRRKKRKRRRPKSRGRPRK
tara:strand:- start:32 stop:298 length:267 start_codon:yes stop_codon:yes gene_type:complete